MMIDRSRACEKRKGGDQRGGRHTIQEGIKRSILHVSNPNHIFFTLYIQTGMQHLQYANTKPHPGEPEN
jgi:hypothetical protein